MSSSAFVPPLLLTIRFSTSLPDVDLDITDPRATTVLFLKHLLRNRLSTPNRLRLIHQGRLLPDSAALSAVIKQPPPAPTEPSSQKADGRKDDHGAGLEGIGSDAKGKGKSVAGAQPVRRIYVNCSIGDELSAEDLAAERAAADKPPEEDTASTATKGAWPAASTRPRPRGFDRLLQSGFTSTEIATLRTQFASVRSENFAPGEPLPSPDTMRSLEDAWIDSNAGELPATGVAVGGLNDDLESGLLDVLARGMMIGFFFPLGSISWLLRQGIWSDKWHFFVTSGVVFSVFVGLIINVTSER
ncbi:DSC E3 ubiquitin ligase complex subunit [Paramyrothecium foliicola]|nr:DSC E3 ubiquitin ligase complex subunit [Paramyrothecium foliicola]